MVYYGCLQPCNSLHLHLTFCLSLLIIHSFETLSKVFLWACSHRSASGCSYALHSLPWCSSNMPCSICNDLELPTPGLDDASDFRKRTTIGVIERNSDAGCIGCRIILESKKCVLGRFYPSLDKGVFFFKTFPNLRIQYLEHTGWWVHIYINEGSCLYALQECRKPTFRSEPMEFDPVLATTSFLAS